MIDSEKTNPERKAKLKQKRQQESYARHYVLTYEKPELMTNWAMVEEITLGTLSHLYKNLGKDSDKKYIARGLGLEAPLLESWLHTLTMVRNICAPHVRWKQRVIDPFDEFPNTPLAPMGLPDDWQQDPFWHNI